MTRYTDPAMQIADKTGLLVEVRPTELDTGVVELDVRYQSTLVIHQQPAPNMLRGKSTVLFSIMAKRHCHFDYDLCNCLETPACAMKY